MIGNMITWRVDKALRDATELERFFRETFPDIADALKDVGWVGTCAVQVDHDTLVTISLFPDAASAAAGLRAIGPLSELRDGKLWVVDVQSGAAFLHVAN